MTVMDDTDVHLNLYSKKCVTVPKEFNVEKDFVIYLFKTTSLMMHIVDSQKLFVWWPRSTAPTMIVIAHSSFLFTRERRFLKQ